MDKSSSRPGTTQIQNATSMLADPIIAAIKKIRKIIKDELILQICVDYCFSLSGQAKPFFFILGLSKNDNRDVAKRALRIG